MNLKFEALILFALVLITSGCLGPSDGETESQGDQALEVVDMSVQPSEIYAGSSSTANLHIRNSGELPATLNINSEGGQYADRVLTNRCRDIFSISDFQVSGPGGVTGESEYELQERNEVRFTWVLENINTDRVPLNGYSCNLKFQVPFDYSVTAYRQLQFKESREIEGTPDLESQSSAGPMTFRIETIGSTAESSSTFLRRDQNQSEIAIYMVNQGDQGTDYTGFIEADFPEIEASGFELSEDNCGETEETITMYNGESERIRCTVDSSVFDDLDSSLRGEIEASTDYTYVQNIGDQTVEVEYRGN